MQDKKTPTTADQKLYKTAAGQLRADIDVYLTQEAAEAPSITECRHAILTIEALTHSGEKVPGYVVYDRLLGRIVNGVFYTTAEDVLQVARLYNEDPDSPQDMIPNGEALNLTYPEVNRAKSVPIRFEDRSNQKGTNNE